jgi:hypothetical protein
MRGAMLSLAKIEESLLKQQEHFININLFLILKTEPAIYNFDRDKKIQQPGWRATPGKWLPFFGIVLGPL